ncbi:MAG: lactate racemase domain-containing protein [Eubacteriales bacterium]|jgi:nickel-dependent lactate racemase
MKNLSLVSNSPAGFSDDEIFAVIEKSLSDRRDSLKKILILPPDITRFHSGAGIITQYIYQLLHYTCEIDILPALGTHTPMTEDECSLMYGDIPYERFIAHNWRTDIVKLGEVPAEFVSEVSEGVVNEAFDVEVNKLIMDPSYDLILSIGQVVPHEVVGMANYSKNVFVGCGGSNMINSSHMLGAFYGLERLMGKDHSPVRKVFDYAESNFIKDLPLTYILTVMAPYEDKQGMYGIFIGRERKYFEQAVELSRQKNIIFTDEPYKKVVVYLDEQEFRSTWLGNKAVYRTRMAIADDGDLIVLAPGVNKFGEDEEIDALIRKYGYVGRLNILKLVEEHDDLKNNLSAAAHLIHGSSDSRFRITYCTKHLTKEEVESVGFNYIPYDDAVKLYNLETLTDGMNTLESGEEIFYISNPALGLWQRK